MPDYVIWINDGAAELAFTITKVEGDADMAARLMAKGVLEGIEEHGILYDADAQFMERY